eukprot:TRINITY_DN51998_c0_g1_i1.p1 TRINITY_DN51998_c0_g1~~TRINITY_DN51998_c0_g1_i1.p1  ORF type:complete len:284 (+),score=46.71 TRINITY_DN51998_c0_g1_i1:123-974(+)
MAPVIKMPHYLHFYAGGSLAAVLFLNHWIDDDSDPSLTDLKIIENQKKIVVPVWITSDFHCPYTLIARRSLEEANKRYPHVKLEVKWNPVQVRTTLPSVGTKGWVEWEEKFLGPGGAEGAQREREFLKERGEMFGLSYATDVTNARLGSTINAHRMSYQALRQFGANKQDALVQLVYRALHEDLKDISSPWVLSELAEQVGFTKNDVVQYLHTDMDRALVLEMVLQNREKKHLNQVPQMHFKGKYYPVNGMQSPDTYAEVLQRYDTYRREELLRRGVTSSLAA